MKTKRIAKNWWVQWSPRDFWLGVSRSWSEATFIGLGPVVLIYCPKCGAHP